MEGAPDPCAVYVSPVPSTSGFLWSPPTPTFLLQEGEPAFLEGIPGAGILKHSTQVLSQLCGNGTLHWSGTRGLEAGGSMGN